MFNSMRVSQRVMRFFLGAALLLMIVPVQASQSIEIRDGDSHNNDIGNLQTLCHVCHSRKTATEMTGAAYVPTGCDARGNPVSPNEYWR